MNILIRRFRAASLIPRQGRKGLSAQAREKAAGARRQGARSAAYALVREHRSNAGDEADAALSRDLGAWPALALATSILVFAPLDSQAGGGIVGWGDDSFGQATAPGGNDYVAITAGYHHGLALKSSGRIVGWGYNVYGQATPPSGNDYVAIAAGGDYGLGLKSNGSIVAWGDNRDGQAVPPTGNDYVAIAAGYYHGLALRSGGSIVGWGYGVQGQTTTPPGNDYVAIAAGGYHGLALKSNGSIVGWGYNVYGQATPPAGNDFAAIAAGGTHSLALKTNGSIVCWGDDSSGQATPPAGNDYVAIAASGRHCLALKSDGSIVGWGENGYGQIDVPAGNGYVSIAAGLNNGLALRWFVINSVVLGGNGSVSPARQIVSSGQSAAVTITPGAGYHVESILDNGALQTIATPYVISRVREDHYVVVTFAPGCVQPSISSQPPSQSRNPRVRRGFRSDAGRSAQGTPIRTLSATHPAGAYAD